MNMSNAWYDTYQGQGEWGFLSQNHEGRPYLDFTNDEEDTLANMATAC